LDDSISAPIFPEETLVLGLGDKKEPTKFTELEPQHEDGEKWEFAVAKDGTPLIYYDGQVFAKAHFLFWGENWQWAEVDLRRIISAQASYTLLGEIPSLGVQFTGEILPEKNNVLSYNFTLRVTRPLGRLIGGGIEFRLGESIDLGPNAKTETLLFTDKTGWRWTPMNGAVFSCSASPPFSECYFEQQNPKIVRCFFLNQKQKVGEHKFSFKITGPENTRFVTSVDDRYPEANLDRWQKGALNSATFPVDLRFLNDPPAGKHGFLKVSGDEFIFEDGTPARFWGCNVAAYALFSDKKHIEQQAIRIAKMGFNLVRIHHHDSLSWVDPSVIDKSRDDTRRLDEKGMDCIHYWVKCLKDQGVYVWLDLHVGRTLKPGDMKTTLGKVIGPQEILRREGLVNGFCYFNPGVTELMKEFNQNYLDHKSPYTGLAFKDDPSVVLLLITNENDLTHHFGNLMLADKNNPEHRAVFLEKIAEFCRRSGYHPNEVEKTWLPGPSKIFLAEVEHSFNEVMISHLRKIGVRIPIATTNSWGGMGIFSLPSLALGDFIDVHSYGETEALHQNPVFSPNYLSWIASAHVANKPLAVSEWNVPYPIPDRCAAPLYTAALAAFQGWDAMLLYNYSQDSFGDDGRLAEWSSLVDPSLAGIMPAAALVFRRPDVALARRTYALLLDEEDTFSQRLDPYNARVLREVPEMHRFVVSVPDISDLSAPAGYSLNRTDHVVHDPHEKIPRTNGVPIFADTKEFCRDPKKGRFLVTTERTQGVTGWLNGETVVLPDLRVESDTPVATVIVSSLDGLPIRESRRLLLTAVARSLKRDDVLPYYSEPVCARVWIALTSGLSVYPLKPDGSKMAPLVVVSKEGGYEISLSADSGSHWFSIE